MGSPNHQNAQQNIPLYPPQFPRTATGKVEEVSYWGKELATDPSAARRNPRIILKATDESANMGGGAQKWEL